MADNENKYLNQNKIVELIVNNKFISISLLIASIVFIPAGYYQVLSSNITTCDVTCNGTLRKVTWLFWHWCISCPP